MGQLYAITPFTLLDYPGETACIAWFAGCNLRCIYCHNPDIVLNRGEKKEGEFIDLLERRRGLLTAAVFSGGEATFCPSLAHLVQKARQLGYKTKLDTNGTRPKVLAQFIENNLFDYIALDYKCPVSHAKGLLGTEKFTRAFNASLAKLIEAARHGLKLEVRTTYHADLLTEDDLSSIIRDLDRHGYCGTYYIQNISSYGEKTLGNIANPMRQLIKKNLFVPKNFSLSFRNFPE